MAINPYVTGNVVGNTSAFVGRADILKEVQRVLHHSQDNAIVLHGQRRIGKTSILRELEARLETDLSVPVFFDLQDQAARHLEDVLRDLAYVISVKLKQSPPELGADPRKNFCQNWLPQVLNNMPDNKVLVLLFDEFDVLNPQSGLAVTEFFPYLRELLNIDSKRLKFVFVVGRRIEDLNEITLSLFKGIRSKRVSLLDENDTIKLVHLSENPQNKTLIWSNEAIKMVQSLTNGHPYLTQCLCSRVWESLHDDSPPKVPKVTKEQVEKAIPDTLEQSNSALVWLWNGLPSTERLVASALAGAGPKPLKENQLKSLLKEKGVDLVIQELHNAAQVLQEWDLIETAGEMGSYRFRVELLRRWIEKEKSFSQTQEEVAKMDMKTYQLYGAAERLFIARNFDSALSQVNKILEDKPNHFRATKLLAEILLEQQKYSDAWDILEGLYQPGSQEEVGPLLIRVLDSLAQVSDNEDEQLKLYERILNISPDHRRARENWQKIWQRRGEETENRGDLRSALAIYQEQEVQLAKKIAVLQATIAQQQEEDFYERKDLKVAYQPISLNNIVAVAEDRPEEVTIQQDNPVGIQILPTKGLLLLTKNVLWVALILLFGLSQVWMILLIGYVTNSSFKFESVMVEGGLSFFSTVLTSSIMIDDLLFVKRSRKDSVMEFAFFALLPIVLILSNNVFLTVLYFSKLQSLLIDHVFVTQFPFITLVITAIYAISVKSIR